MTKLEKLYASIKNLQELGLPLNKETLAAADNLEEQLIKSEILPAMSKDVEPLLSQIQRDLVLVVEYHPGEPISVALSRKTKITDIAGTKQLTHTTGRESIPVTANEPATAKEPHEPTKQVENPTKGLKVTFSDGTVVWGRTAIDTFIQTIRRIGFERVAAIGITHAGHYNLVSRQQRQPEPGRIWQHECDGWYVYSNISNQQKRDDLKQISNKLHLGLKIEDGKP